MELLKLRPLRSIARMPTSGVDSPALVIMITFRQLDIGRIVKVEDSIGAYRKGSYTARNGQKSDALISQPNRLTK